MYCTLSPGTIVSFDRDRLELEETTRGLGTVSEKVGEWTAWCPVFVMVKETVDCSPATSDFVEAEIDRVPLVDTLEVLAV